MALGARRVAARAAARTEAERLAAQTARREALRSEAHFSTRSARGRRALRTRLPGNYMTGRASRGSSRLAIAAEIPSGGRSKAMMNRILAKKGRYAAGAVVAAGGYGMLKNHRRSGLDRPAGRPTGPFVY